MITKQAKSLDFIRDPLPLVRRIKPLARDDLVRPRFEVERVLDTCSVPIKGILHYELLGLRKDSYMRQLTAS